MPLSTSAMLIGDSASNKVILEDNDIIKMYYYLISKL